MERIKDSGISKIVGVDSKTEEALLDAFRKRFEQKVMPTFELEHSIELDNVLHQINLKLKEFLQEFEIKSIDIPNENVLIIDRSRLSAAEAEALAMLPGLEGTSGAYIPSIQKILCFSDFTADKLRFAHIITHEMLHINSFVSLEKTSGDDYATISAQENSQPKEESFSLRGRRAGFRIDSPKGIVYFAGLDEAIIEELTIRFDHKFLSTFPELQDSLKNGVGKMNMKQAYQREREQFNELVSDLYRANQDSFQSEEEVFVLFVKAVFSGQLLPVARLIETTYGKGVFKSIAKGTGQIK